MNDQGKPDLLRLHQLTTNPLLICRIKGESPWRPRFSRYCSRVFGVLVTGRMTDQGRLNILRLNQLTTIPLLRCHIKVEFPLRPRFSRACSRVFGVLMVNSFPHMRNESVILSPKVNPMISFRERGMLVAVFQKALRWSGGWELVSPQLSCMKLKCDYSDQHPDSPKRFMRVFLSVMWEDLEYDLGHAITHGRCLIRLIWEFSVKSWTLGPLGPLDPYHPAFDPLRFLTQIDFILPK